MKIFCKYSRLDEQCFYQYPKKKKKLYVYIFIYKYLVPLHYIEKIFFNNFQDSQLDFSTWIQTLLRQEKINTKRVKNHVLITIPEREEKNCLPTHKTPKIKRMFFLVFFFRKVSHSNMFFFSFLYLYRV